MAEQDHPSDELELDQQLCFALHSTSLAMTRVYKPLLKALGLTYPQYLAMLILWQQDGLTVGALSKRLMTDPGSLTPVLKRLEADGRLKRVRAEHDERVVQVWLTTQGRELKARASHIPGCMIDASAHSPQELLALKEALVTLREQLHKAL
ncbi:MarR family winged helix-turn-helix transcriptional regulator [Halomonas sp. HNIBRBA4712]|uniref:MarR family winged helix-turn-helix transcriptional regulator n=1 Tax=Halomonas sp. HNIBRBA4712 TaxID=3373087 RepID=UPI003744C98A